MGVSEYLPVAVAGCCAAAVAYIALSQAYEAEVADDTDSPSTTRSEASKAASVAPKAVANGAIAPAGQHAAEASTSSSSSSTAPSSSSGGNPSNCNHCKKVPARQDHLLRCSRCHHAWYCSKVWAASTWGLFCCLHECQCRPGQCHVGQTCSCHDRCDSNGWCKCNYSRECQPVAAVAELYGLHALTACKFIITSELGWRGGLSGHSFPHSLSAIFAS